LPKVNKLPITESSPNLVTLAFTEVSTYLCTYVQRCCTNWKRSGSASRAESWEWVLEARTVFSYGIQIYCWTLILR
jgi:hypothetical protein